MARYETPAAAHRLVGLTCSGYGSIADKTVGIERPALGSHAVVYVYAGSGWLETAATSGRQHIRSGDLVWLFPTVAHAYAPGGAGWSEHWAMFEGPLTASFEQLGFLSPARPISRPDGSVAVDALFAQLRADFSGRVPHAGLLGGALLHRLILLAQGLDRTDGADQPSPAWTVQRALAIIGERALQPLDLHAVATECGVGYSTLRRHFRQATGCSLKEYILRVRLSRAKELLVRTPMGVAEVAYAAGFNDPYYFARLFRRREGCPPTAFRAQRRF